MFRFTNLFHNCFVRIIAYSLELSPRFTNFSEPAKMGYRRAFSSLKHKKIIRDFIESRPTDQNAYCSDICNT